MTDSPELIAAIIGAVFVGTIALVRSLIPYIAKKKSGDSIKPPPALPEGMADTSGGFPATLPSSTPPADFDWDGLQQWVTSQRDRQPATQGDVQALSDRFGEWGEAFAEHVKEDAERFDAIMEKLETLS